MAAAQPIAPVPLKDHPKLEPKAQRIDLRSQALGRCWGA